MWPLVDVGADFLMTMVGRCYGQRIINTFGWTVDNRTGGEQPTDAFTNSFFADAEFIAFKEAYLDCLPNVYSLDEVWLQKLTPVRVRKGVLEVGEDGALDAPALVQSQATISRHGVTAARFANGGVRILMPAGDEYSQLGLITLAHKARLQTLANLMVDPIQLNVMGTFYDLLPALLAPGATPGTINTTPVVETNVQDQLRTQRTRVVGRGE